MARAIVIGTTPIVVTISHQLGRDEAKRRVDGALGSIRDQLAAFASAIEYGWDGYRLEFGLTALRQRVSGRIDIEDRLVRVELGLPPWLDLFAKPVVNRIRRQGMRLLGKPPG